MAAARRFAIAVLGRGVSPVGGRDQCAVRQGRDDHLAAEDAGRSALNGAEPLHIARRFDLRRFDYLIEFLRIDHRLGLLEMIINWRAKYIVYDSFLSMLFYCLQNVFFECINRPMNLINTKEAAERLGISIVRVRQLIYAGKIEAQNMGRDYAINADSLAKVVVYGKPGRPSAKKAAKRAKKRGA